ncbi:hypothetical protein [Spongiactinospora sp. TRM90649]|uniref:hypothetical protein n=1 Tax=Spongiactinospora sp. TRM90649 TaxID=3031114 RepID=UPI0023F838CD|nr:hypothetical protein [Spongiactinospora sp. TRM90649]MDF5752601.1 hypothetical protein [Spongiactinospora sp. TRM90649]
MSDGGPSDLARTVLVVWEVEAGDQGAGGVTLSRTAAHREMVRALDQFHCGRGRVRLALLAPGFVYRYGETVVTAHRNGRAFVAVAGDAWCDHPLKV